MSSWYWRRGDIGTHVLPDAEVKIFLVAFVKERAKRRYEENRKRNTYNISIIEKRKSTKRDEDLFQTENFPLIKAEKML